MKLSTKLTLFLTLSKLSIALFFVLALPYIVDWIAFTYTNNMLERQKEKVLEVVSQKGTEFYLAGQESYGGYTMLKEEFIALSPVNSSFSKDTTQTEKRIIEQDTLTYRVLSHTFRADGKKYLLEVGKTTSTISQYNRPLQRIALYVLMSLIVITLIIDLVFTHYLIKPLSAIINSKLVNQKFPFSKNQKSVRTSTTDFQYLDKSLMLLMEQINEVFEKEREFTANASHELMTPISILQNKIENLMGDPDVNTTVQQRIMEMMRTLNRLKKIVNSLLLISRIENEQFARSDSTGVKVLIQEVMDEIGHRLDEQNISYKLEITQNFTLININHDLVFQLFYNLINNAIKYNKPEGHIFIKDELTNGIYTINISDSGIGISEDEIPLIFNRFKKSNYSDSGGFGLGLSIVKSIATYHNISLKVKSDKNVGSTFSIHFPNALLRFESAQTL